MGGKGSGPSFKWDAKRTVDDHNSIDIRRWKKRGLLSQSEPFKWVWYVNGYETSSIRVFPSEKSIEISYNHSTNGSKPCKFHLNIQTSWTKCHFGGFRPWFICPGENCGKRVAKLFCQGNFICRNCCSLTYPSQREQDLLRISRQIDKIRNRLKWEPGFLNGDGERPKGMHHSTFIQLSDKHDDLVNKCYKALEISLNS